MGKSISNSQTNRYKHSQLELPTMKIYSSIYIKNEHLTALAARVQQNIRWPSGDCVEWDSGCKANGVSY